MEMANIRFEQMQRAAGSNVLVLGSMANGRRCFEGYPVTGIRSLMGSGHRVYTRKTRAPSACYVPGIPTGLYPLIFALRLISGWSAHVMARYANN